MNRRIQITKRFIFAASLALFCLLIPVHSSGSETNSPKEIVSDISRLNPVQVSEIVMVHEIADIQKAINRAKESNRKIAIAGKRHSQGGHIAYDDAIVLDMREFNKVLSLDEKNRVVTVQTGATWEDVQNYINSYGLAVKVMQASNIFTVGGSLGSNVHGNDPTFGPLIQTVRSFHLLLADGTLVNVSRTENAELFGLAIGGFGLLGVITDVDLELTDNEVYETSSEIMNYDDYPSFFEKEIKNNPIVGNHSAKLSIAPESLLKKISVSTYRKTDKRPPGIFALSHEQHIERNKFLFELSRLFGWGKTMRWDLQNKLVTKIGVTETVSRNNTMRPIVKFLDYHSRWDTDILQEYFIPQEQFAAFIDGLRNIIVAEDINLLSVTVRYVPQNTEAYLSYAQENSFSVVLYINQKLSQKGIDKARSWTRKIVDLALGLKGTYYLTYQLYPSHDQVRRAYPQLESFFERKKFFDSAEIFMNKFYENYAVPAIKDGEPVSQLRE